MEGIEIRCEKHVYQRGVKDPAFLYDKRDFVRLKVGTLDFVQAEYERMRRTYLEHGLVHMANDLAILELPPNQELFDLLYQKTGLLQRFVENPSMILEEFLHKERIV